MRLLRDESHGMKEVWGKKKGRGIPGRGNSF
jgi:hypothetical protein